MKNLLRITLILGFLGCMTMMSYAQVAKLTGLTKEENNLGKVKNVNVTVYDAVTNKVVANTISNNDGAFTINVKAGDKYRLVAEKESFFYTEKELIVKEGLDSIQFIMERKPGYNFDVSIISADRKHISGTARVENLIGARIEVYNNTRRRQELSLRDHPISSFRFNFEEGNHYTIMVRKKGYLTKRIEAYINIKGCILCFDGMGMVRPNVVDVLANENQLGSFLGTLEMEPVKINKTFTIENLYYDYNKYNIRPDAAEVLDNVLTVLLDNPAIQLEMGSHTDARGSDAYNMSLSDKRAKSAMEYLISKGISRNLLTWKGYGESVIINECTNGVKCSDAKHERNRRTELKIVGILDEDPLDKKTLKQIIESDPRMAPTPFRKNPFLNN